ncbi:hypothetical protein F5876DRAFT_68316 [Lentinula aff. lateritia]|uniref:Uncharacterized protein n=1 Tax=Lentinula aff. lateritia TaxID=2804960 RepID=A0ACC1TRR6_9AGAR|nr:hypothetical protein F5876DRAFT_68316 [Lentinula aff. lateritia]
MHFSFIFATFALALIAHAAPLNVDYSSSLDNSLEPYLTRALEFSARADVNPQILKVGIRFNDAKEEVAPTYRNDALTAQRNSDPLHYRFNVPNRILQRASVLIDSFAQAKGLGPANTFLSRSQSESVLVNSAATVGQKSKRMDHVISIWADQMGIKFTNISSHKAKEGRVEVGNNGVVFRLSVYG